ncbi:MAG: PASTA domain-containing protein [Sphingomonadales bacterium]
MPSFEIAEGPTSVSLEGSSTDPKAPRKGSAVYNVTNRSGQTAAGRLSIQTTGQSKAEWFSIDGERERNFAPGETQTAAVTISVPPDVAAGDYAFRVRVVAVNDPDNDHAEGPITSAKVPPPSTAPKKALWPWIVAAIVLLLVLGVGGYFLFKPAPEENGNQVAPTHVVPNLVGKSLAEATPLASGYDLVPTAGAPAGNPPNTITSQSPAAGRALEPGFPIRVTFDPGVQVPSLTNQTTDQAVNTLRPLQLHVSGSTTRCETAGDEGRIVDQKPGPNAMVASGTGVEVVVRTHGGAGIYRKFGCGRRLEGILKVQRIDQVERANPIILQR